jgi:hypothetical protein
VREAEHVRLAAHAAGMEDEERLLVQWWPFGGVMVLHTEDQGVGVIFDAEGVPLGAGESTGEMPLDAFEVWARAGRWWHCEVRQEQRRPVRGVLA